MIAEPANPWQDMAIQLMQTGQAVKNQKFTGTIFLRIECNQGGPAKKKWTIESDEPMITQIKFDK